MSRVKLEDDLKTALLAMSEQIGFKISSKKDLNETLLDYLTIKRKIIDPKPRQIRINPDFKPIIPNHLQAREIMAILHLSKTGGNLNMFQSKRLVQSNFHDHLLNEWNIFHFHLSLEKDKKSKFYKQVDQLLFAYIDDDQIIFLGTDKHTDGIFADPKWIEILHDHFPKVIEQYRDDSIEDVSPKVTAAERQRIWNHGYTLGMTKIRDVVYFSPGFGRTGSGHGLEVIRTGNKILRWIYAIQKQVTENHERICNTLNIPKNSTEFSVQFGENTLELVEKRSNLQILEYPQALDLNKLK